eukprot:CAMPEP_0202459164 /NCGR_PEP_ID=MMETSP1360-20130828/32429_1 /ASSEMBLY_ACC=CAM_ASM_000848 /TAXON_ID=515479 /ORGANISM="Licmophora paradoxa, Strain CCMP2313" /LENGTH=162 /DNA_ID=CAMNT_0049080075 /DNA_START=18 /DNA_END=506 /DNA_ORIENTATION=-
MTMMTKLISFLILTVGTVGAFAPLPIQIRTPTKLFGDFAQQVTGGELEVMMQEMTQPIVVDAYATWCGPCLLMAPEFEEAAKELDGKVRFVKLDTDKEENMAAALRIEGLPTLLFLEEYKGDEPGTSAALKGRLEGALRKDMIVKLCDHYFFDGPVPDFMSS